MQSLTISVCSHGGSDFNSISEAIKNAGPGDVIILKAGQYDERVVLDKPITIKGEETETTTSIINEDGTVTTSSSSAVSTPESRKNVIIAGGFVATADGCGISNVTIQQGVDIRSGTCRISECNIEHGDGIKVGQNSQASISKSLIVGASQLGDGVYFMEGAKGLITECEIRDHRVNGIHLKGAEVDIIKNTIKNSRYGIYYRKNAKGNCEGNNISDISNHGIYATQGSSPNVVNNNISSCAIQGIIVATGTSGTYRANVVDGNVHICAGATCHSDGNTISGFYDNEPNNFSNSGAGQSNIFTASVAGK